MYTRRILIVLMTVIGIGVLLGTHQLRIRRIHDPDQQLAYWRTQLERDPQSAFVNLCALYSQRGELDMALDYCNRALALNQDNPDALQNRAVTYRKHGQLEKSLADWKRVLQLAAQYKWRERHRAWRVDLIEREVAKTERLLAQSARSD